MEIFHHLHPAGPVLSLLRPLFEQNAYLDPGSGSFLIQLLLAALLGGLFLLRSYWKKVMAFFSRLFNREKPSQEDDE